MSLDGVIDTPSWTFDYGFDPRMGHALADLIGRCEAILLGRNTYEMFEPAWSSRTAEEDPGAPFMNDTAKYVVSSKLVEATWNNSEVLGSYSSQTIRQLKQRVQGGIYVSGSGTPAPALVADGLLDELHLFVYPLTRGVGMKLFPEGMPTKWSLSCSDTYDNGVIYLVYEPV